MKVHWWNTFGFESGLDTSQENFEVEQDVYLYDEQSSSPDIDRSGWHAQVLCRHWQCYKILQIQRYVNLTHLNTYIAANYCDYFYRLILSLTLQHFPTSTNCRYCESFTWYFSTICNFPLLTFQFLILFISSYIRFSSLVIYQ